MSKATDEIIKHFDFEKVHKTMVTLNWTWQDSPEPPTIGELVLTAQELLTDLVEKNHTAIGTGGFMAYRNETADERTIGLRFDVTDMEVSDDKE